jgi:hypothetical protein
VKRLINCALIFILACMGAYGQGQVENRDASIVDQPDTLASAEASDSAHARESDAARMYQSAVSKMRRDVPRQGVQPDTSANRRRMTITEPEASSPPGPTLNDSLSVAVNGNQPVNQPAAEHKPHIKNSAVILAAGSCALIGCGIAVYLLKASKNDDIIARNNRIPPPPDPPVNIAPLR